MGRVIVSVALSVDGYSEGPGADISVMPLDEGINIHHAALIAGTTTLLYGGTTYRQMVGHWPGVVDDPDASDAEHAIADRMAAGLPVVAVSDTLSDADTGPWREQTTIVRRADAQAAVRHLRDQAGDTTVFGSRTVWADLLTQGLVDELHLLIGPKVVAGDVAAFDGVQATSLRLLDVQRLPGSDLVVLRYAVDVDAS